MVHLLEQLTGRSREAGLDRAALEMARVEYPGLDIEPFMGVLDCWAVELAERAGGGATGADYVAAANRYLFGELGFAGNRASYHDPRNSCLNEVLTARTGIPITLAVVYLEIGRRLKRPVYGIGLPGHFLVQYRAADFAAYIDVFDGGRLLTAAECIAAGRQASGLALREDPRLLAPVGNRQILMRMLHNLRGAYLRRRAYGKALQTLDLLVAGDPQSGEEHKMRGMLHLQMQNAAAARGDLENYLRLSPEAADRAEIEARLRALRSYQAGLN